MSPDFLFKKKIPSRSRLTLIYKCLNTPLIKGRFIVILKPKSCYTNKSNMYIE